MDFSGAKREIFKAVIMFVEIDMVNHFTFTKRTANMCCYHHDMLCNITATPSIRMFRHENVEVAVPKCGPLSALAFGFCNENTTAFPRRISWPSLIAFRGFSGNDPKFPHCIPHNFLRCSVPCPNLSLGEAKDGVIMDKLLLSERNAVGVLVHAGIISNASIPRKDSR